jgi:hypothetical protein
MSKGRPTIELSKVLSGPIARISEHRQFKEFLGSALFEIFPKGCTYGLPLNFPQVTGFEPEVLS